MIEALVITPVKDSLETTCQTIEAVSKAKGNFKYVVFNDFSGKETKDFLDRHQALYNFQVIHLEEVTTHPSPNYKLALQMAQEMALAENAPLIVIESDVIVQENTIAELVEIANQAPVPGLVGAITVDQQGNYNFPYAHEKRSGQPWEETNHSLSFCCTLITADYLRKFNFRELSTSKDWFDIFISRQSKRLGLKNYLVKKLEVVHLPHSSRPWKKQKYSSPFLYYLNKFLKRRDRI